jgi:release factor glutamine methyltransferase
MNTPPTRPRNSEASLASDTRRIDAVIGEVSRLLGKAGVESAGLDARLLVAHACGLSHENLVAQSSRLLSDPEHQNLDLLVCRRQAREPVSRILGRRAFWSHEFSIGPATLDPRPDTETLIELAVALIGEERHVEKTLAIADIGTGSGCILLSLLDELPNAWGVGSDVSAEAIGLAISNARALGLSNRAHFAQASWLDGLAGPFDLLVANPPYIPSAEISSLAPEVALFDPRLALDGGADGLEPYRAIAGRLGEVLRPGGWAVFEIGMGQSRAVADLLVEAGFELDGRSYREKTDLAGVIRGVAVMQR